MTILAMGPGKSWLVNQIMEGMEKEMSINIEKEGATAESYREALLKEYVRFSNSNRKN